MRSLLLATILTLPALCCAQSAAITLTCPRLITTKQSLHEPVSGWRESQERPFSNEHLEESGYSEHNLDYVTFSEGVPEDRGTLVPTSQSKVVKGRSSAHWTWRDSQTIWFACRYRATSVMLSQQLPPKLKGCTVQYDENRGISIQKVSCE